MTNLNSITLEKPVSPKASVLRPANEWEPIAPIPHDAPLPDFHHYRHGTPSTRYAYKNSEGAILRYVCRFDFPDKRKEFAPYTLCRDAHSGKLEWRWRDVPPAKTLYGLEFLHLYPDTSVIVVEGEKACDAARKLLPQYLVVASSGGSNAAHKSDWMPLIGRKVIIWPDADEAGKNYAESVNKELQKTNIKPLVIPPISNVAEGWDAADALQQGFSEAQANELIQSARPLFKKTQPSGYITKGGFLYYRDIDADKPDIKFLLSLI